MNRLFKIQKQQTANTTKVRVCTGAAMPSTSRGWTNFWTNGFCFCTAPCSESLCHSLDPFDDFRMARIRKEKGHIVQKPIPKDTVKSQGKKQKQTTDILALGGSAEDAALLKNIDNSITTGTVNTDVSKPRNTHFAL